MTINTTKAEGQAGTSAAADRSSTAPGNASGLAGRLAERGGVIILLGAFIVLFCLMPATSELFRTSANVQNILANQSVTGLIAIGMVVPLVAGYMDMSVPAVAGVSNVLVATLLATYGLPIWVGIVAGVVVGAVLGAITGVLVAVLRLSPFIITLGIYVLISGLLQLYTGGAAIISGMPQELGEWGAGKTLGIARPFWLLLLGAVVLWFFLTQTTYGRRLAAIGSNESAARLAGIRVDRAIWGTFVIAGVLGGIAGVMLTMRNGAGDATSGISFLFPAFAAVFLGQTAINPGFPNIWGTIVAVFLIAVAINGFTLLGAQSWASDVFNGAILIVSVAGAVFIARYRERRAKDRLSAAGAVA